MKILYCHAAKLVHCHYINCSQVGSSRQNHVARMEQCCQFGDFAARTFQTFLATQIVKIVTFFLSPKKLSLLVKWDILQHILRYVECKST